MSDMVLLALSVVILLAGVVPSILRGIRVRKLEQWKLDMQDPVKRRAYMAERGLL